MSESSRDLISWLSQKNVAMNTMETILDTLDALVLILDSQGRVVLFNKTCASLTGYSADEVVGRAFYDMFLIPEEIEPVKAVFSELNAGIFPNKHENYWVTKKGERRWISWSNTALLDDRGVVAYVVGTGQDRTEQRAAEERLRQSEQDFRMVADYTYDCEHWIDQTGRLRYISPACERITGYAPEDFYQNPELLHQIIHPEDRRRYENHTREHLRMDAPATEIEFRVINKDGHTRWITHGCQSVFDANGQWLGRRISNRDDTDRKQAEQNVRRTEEQTQKKNAVLDAINSVLLETLTCETDAEVARVCLEKAEKITGSRFGFIGEINKDGRFDTIAISNPGWNDCRVPESEAVLLIRNMEIRGLWGAVIKSGMTLVTNEPSSHPERVGPPAGHPPLTSFLGTPLRQKEKVIGMCAMANKEAGYDEQDAEAMEALAVAFVQALHRKRVEAQLAKERMQLTSIFDGINEIVYVADPDTYEILFMNQALKNIFGDAQGEICYEVFQGKSAPCEFCTNDVIFGEKSSQSHVWEFFNESAACWFRCVDKAIPWTDGRQVRYEMAIDITDIKEAEEAIRRSAISRQLVADMFRDLQKFSDLSDGDLFKAGYELAGRIDSNNIDEFIEAFTSMGFGNLDLVEKKDDRHRWIFTGDKLMGSTSTSTQPTDHYTRGFLCGTVSRTSGLSRVVGVETNCQSMGDPECRFVIQAIN